MAPDTSAALLTAYDLSLVVGSNRPLLNRITLELNQGQVGVLLGGNGVGKSTLLRTLAGLSEPAQGRVELDGEELTQFSADKSGYVVERPEIQGITDSVQAELELVLAWNHQPPDPAWLGQLLETFALSDLVNRSPSTLSAGELQRLNLAVALAPRPRVLLLDDPFVFLDVDSARSAWLGVLSAVQDQKVGGALLVTHDVECAAEADLVGVLDHGTLCSWGKPEAVLIKDMPSSIEPPLAVRLAGALRERGWRLDAAGVTPESLGDCIVAEAECSSAG